MQTVAVCAMPAPSMAQGHTRRAASPLPPASLRRVLGFALFAVAGVALVSLGMMALQAPSPTADAPSSLTPHRDGAPILPRRRVTADELQTEAAMEHAGERDDTNFALDVAVVEAAREATARAAKSAAQAWSDRRSAWTSEAKALISGELRALQARLRRARPVGLGDAANE